ncbi:MAG: sugar-binding protein [Bacteroidota bacterium]|nr:sugar-binding protein [Bacteroidota bacterium]
MKKILCTVFIGLLMFGSQLRAQTVENFDGKWATWSDEWWNAASNVTHDYDSTFKDQGAASLKIDWKTVTEGGYAGISFARFTGASETSIDMSGYDSLVFYMYVDRAAHSNDTYLAIIFRENPSDASYSVDPTQNNFQTEMWRHQYNGIFTTNTKVWKRISVPLKVVGDPTNPQVSDWNAGWNRQGVGAGRYNNAKFDLNSIRGFYMEFDSDSSATNDSCLVYFDNMMLVGHQVTPLVLFNGRFVAPGVQMTTGWSGTVEIDPTQDYDGKGTGAVKWTGDDGWDGVWWNISSPKNLGPNWMQDTIQFAIKAPKGFGKLYVALTDPQTTTPSAYQVVYEMPESVAVPGGYDGNWHLIRVPLSNFAQWGSWDSMHDKSKRMDSSMIAQFRIEGDGQNIKGKVVWFDNIWTGTQSFDIAAPIAPKNVSGVKNGNYINTISWDYDLSGKNPAYNIYTSAQAITDVHAQGVLPIALGLKRTDASTTGLYDTRLVAPQKDAPNTSYYAVTAVDLMGVEGPVGASGSVTNTAKGMVVINSKAPTGFVLDGSLTEWASIRPIRLNPKDGSGHVVQNTVFKDSADLNVKAYLAMDDKNLYVAFDITDDSVITNDGSWPGQDYDSPELYIGLYDGAKIAHFSTPFHRGAAPEYKLRFSPNQIFVDDPVWGTLVDTAINKVNYIWKKKPLSPGYIIEAKIPFDTLAKFGGDSVFKPVYGTKIPIDFQVNDRDISGDPGANGLREGLLTYAVHDDNIWGPPSLWTYTWIGDPTTGVDNASLVATTYSLSQNYPNPFNPSTQIKYSLEKGSIVTLKVYDVIGREVATVVNEFQNSGNYTVNFNTSQKGRTLASGVYFYSINAGAFHSVKKMMLLK